MHNVELVNVLDARHELLQEARSLLLLHAAVRDNVVEQLAARRVLHDEAELLVGLDDLRRGEALEGRATYLVELHELRVTNDLENVDFAGDALHVGDICDFVLFEDFDGDLRCESVLTVPFRL